MQSFNFIYYKRITDVKMNTCFIKVKANESKVIDITAMFVVLSTDVYFTHYVAEYPMIQEQSYLRFYCCDNHCCFT